MRTASVRGSPLTATCTIASRALPSSSASSSGAIVASGLPAGASEVPSKVCAELFISRTVRSPAIEITPADTPDITASISARRLSSWALAVTSALFCASSRSVMRLNAVASVPTSSRAVVSGTRAERSPPSTRRAASTSCPTGRTSRSATASAIHTATPTISSDNTSSATLKRICSVRALASSA